ncbi:MAG: tripartite tricarboxylate transporter substrate binding protein BugD [Alphaproteobacteria bacterium]|nr:MAG: tripartite tricarboxylate transporter substrate binding protein BugD [Alphaproteobacteria bacterium]
MPRLLHLERDDFRSNRHPALISFYLSMFFFAKWVPSFARHALAIALSALACIRPAGAQEWPTRPITMVVPFAAGGPADTVGRILSPGLSEFLGQQVIIENVGGSGGMNGASRVAKAAADGSQLVLGNMGTHAANQTFYKTPLYNAATDFTPVILIAQTPLVLLARNDLPADDLRQFISYAKSHQARMQYGSGGVGSASHLACALLNAAIGVNITHVPYRGAAPAMQDLIAGRIDYQCPDSPIAIPQIDSKMVKAIAVLSRDRSASLPAQPSAHEQGLTNFDASNWFALFFPKGAPAAIVERLHAAAVATLESAAVRSRMQEIGADVTAPERRSPDYLQRFIESEIVKWAAPIKASGASSDN